MSDNITINIPTTSPTVFTAEAIEEWHRRARPNPDKKAFNVQLGCHFEEIVEMLCVINISHSNDTLNRARAALSFLADSLKRGFIEAEITDREEFLDSVADQVVTSIGSAYCAGMRPSGALWEVNKSNWSKFVNGEPVFNENGKIAKPAAYTPPNLDGLY